MLFIIQQEWYRGIGDKLPSLSIEMEVFCYKKEDRMMEGYQKYK